MTWDHVPPKCCNNSYRIRVNSWPEGMPEENFYEKEYQSGIRYRSLCSECNNHLLGINYDIVLADFTAQIMNILQSENPVPTCMYVRVKVNKLSRAICGHILAAKNYYEKDCLVDKKLREYVVSELSKRNLDVTPKNNEFKLDISEKTIGMVARTMAKKIAKHVTSLCNQNAGNPAQIAELKEENRRLEQKSKELEDQNKKLCLLLAESNKNLNSYKPSIFGFYRKVNPK